VTSVPYRALWREAGARTCVAYLRQNHLFDLLRRVDTHGWTGRMEYPSGLVDDTDTKIYMPVWTSTVRRSLRAAMRQSGWPASFVDLGCGKGKALLLAHEVFGRRRWRRRTPVQVVGVEHHQGLAVVAERNLWKRTRSLGDVRVGDAAVVAFDDLPDPMLVFLYNPFTGDVLHQVAKRLATRVCTVVYVNPVEPEAFTTRGFRVVHHHPDWHPVATFTVLASRYVRRKGEPTVAVEALSSPTL
jgi:SAM-dependent methyltransferase